MVNELEQKDAPGEVMRQALVDGMGFQRAWEFLVILYQFLH